MQFTGERFVPTEQGKIRLEHYHRYATVLDAVAGKKVLDLACGEGYGSNLMAERAHSVVGVDVSSESVQHAADTYQKANLKFCQGNAAALCFSDASFDVVISFETIEHLAEQTKMIQEIRRVLRSDGILVMSSPNRPIYSEESGEHNEFHVKELDYDEFDALLKTEFPSVRYYGQRMLMGSVIQSLDEKQNTFKAWHENGSTIVPRSGSLREPVYFIAVASRSGLQSNHFSSSIMYPSNLDLVKHYVGFAKWAKQLDVVVSEKDRLIVEAHQEIEKRDAQITGFYQTVIEKDAQIVNLYQTVIERDANAVNLTSALVERDARIADLSQTVAERDAHLNNVSQQIAEQDAQITDFNLASTKWDAQSAYLQQTIAERDAELANLKYEAIRLSERGLKLDAELEQKKEMLLEALEVINKYSESHSWRYTAPLREVKHWLSQPGGQSKQYAKKSLGVVKRLYQALPLNPQKVEDHRKFFNKRFPKLLQVTETRSNGHDVNYLSIENLDDFNLPKLSAKQDFSESISDGRNIKLNISENPVVSVIIPVYGQVGYTLRCLASIAANPPQLPFEVIVVDDNSPDDSAAVLANVEGIHLIQSERNQGFIRSVNTGANAAQGKYLYFLNNDTQVTPGWLDELVRTFREFPGTGLVGSKLVYPNGDLQEAGGIIWQDGSAWNFGRFQNPLLPIYNYAREVDYCSGASIMIPGKLFHQLGGFDEHYLPAYCEDSDLALKVREKGLRVIYQPLSTIIHYEGVSSGTELSAGAKSYQVENTKKLFARWEQRLRLHQPNGIDVDNAKDRKAKRRVLVLEHCTPTPDHDAGSVTVVNLMLLLREMDFQVTFIPEDNFLYLPDYTTDLQRVGIEVLYAPFVTSVDQHLKEHGARYDLVFLFRPKVVERNIEAVRQYCPQAKTLFYTHDLHFVRMAREAALFEDADKAEAAAEMKVRELTALNAVDASIVVSEKELEAVQNDLPADKLHVLPLILNAAGTDKGFSDRKDLIFVGGFQHPPNADAVKYFAAEIMPIIRRELPGVCFYVVGSKVTDEIKALAADDIIITGFIEDLTSLLDKMRVSVAPLRYGAGVKGKVGTAMAAGVPVVTTTIGAEGMSLTDGENIVVADDAENFAKAVIEVYRDKEFWNKLSQNGLEFADNAWGAKSIWNILTNILQSLNLNVSGSDDKVLRLYSSKSDSSLEVSQVKEATAQMPQSSNTANYENKILQELAIYEQQVKVHDLPEIFHYWSSKYLTPMFREAGFDSIEEFFSANLLDAKKRTKTKCARFISIGAGNCDVEISVASKLIAQGCEDFIFECVEINPVMLERGKIMAQENNVFEKMRFVEADFNKWTAEHEYDGIIANQSLHHVMDLEHLFEQTQKSLHANGKFAISDTIGRNGHQRWQESLEIVQEFWKELPQTHKFNLLLNRFEEEYINWDCSKEGFEGIRAQDILPLLLQRFEFETFIGFGNAIDIFVDRCFGHHFNPELEWNKKFIDRVHLADEIELKSGKLTPTHMIAVCVKNLHNSPFYSRGINPTAAVRRS